MTNKTAYELALIAEQEQDKMLEVVRYQAEGRTKRWIQQKTNVSFKEQNEIKKEFADYVNNDAYIQHRAKEAIGQIDTHYTSLLEKFYAAHDDAVSADDYKIQAAILKNIADVEKQRVDFLSKAGLLAEQNIGDQVAEAEEKIEAIKRVLKEVAKEYPEAGKLIAKKLSELDGTVVAERA